MRRSFYVVCSLSSPHKEVPFLDTLFLGVGTKEKVNHGGSGGIFIQSIHTNSYRRPKGPFA